MAEKLKVMPKGPNDVPKMERQHITLSEDIVPGIGKKKPDAIITVSLKIKVTKVGRNTWRDRSPLEAEGEIISGALAGVKVMDKIDKAETMKELDKAIGKEQSLETMRTPSKQDRLDDEDGAYR